MTGGNDNLDSARPGLLGDAGSKVPIVSSGIGDRSEKVYRDVHCIQYGSCPVPFTRIKALRCRRIGKFVGDFPAQLIIE